MNAPWAVPSACRAAGKARKEGSEVASAQAVAVMALGKKTRCRKSFVSREGAFRLPRRVARGGAREGGTARSSPLHSPLPARPASPPRARVEASNLGRNTASDAEAKGWDGADLTRETEKDASFDRAYLVVRRVAHRLACAIRSPLVPASPCRPRALGRAPKVLATMAVGFAFGGDRGKVAGTRLRLLFDFWISK